MAEENVGDKTWLTKEAHERLTKELEHLQGPVSYTHLTLPTIHG